jgi:alpha-beta hydrolase superfamily lysophospholipase
VEVETFRDRHGVDVFTRRWPVADAAGLVAVSHGASEHSGRYDHFARALNDAGFAVVALDHRGHGHTATATGVGRMGAPGGQALVDDLDELLDRALATQPDVPVALFGHSLGSLIVLAYLTEHSARLTGGVLSGFPASIDDVAALGEVFATVDAAAREEPVDLLSGFNEPFAPARTPYDWLSRDEAEVDRYLDDPLSGDDMPLTQGYVADLFQVVAPAVTRLASITCPVLVIAGDRDPSGAMGAHPKLLADRLADAGVPVELHLYPDARHELLNETNRDEVTADLINWLTRR